MGQDISILPNLAEETLYSDANSTGQVSDIRYMRSDG